MSAPAIIASKAGGQRLGHLRQAVLHRRPQPADHAGPSPPSTARDAHQGGRCRGRPGPGRSAGLTTRWPPAEPACHVCGWRGVGSSAQPLRSRRTKANRATAYATAASPASTSRWPGSTPFVSGSLPGVVEPGRQLGPAVEARPAEACCRPGSTPTARPPAAAEAGAGPPGHRSRGEAREPEQQGQAAQVDGRRRPPPYVETDVEHHRGADGGQPGTSRGGEGDPRDQAGCLATAPRLPADRGAEQHPERLALLLAGQSRRRRSSPRSRPGRSGRSG